MQNDLPPFARRVLSTAGAIFCLSGVLVQGAGLLGTLWAGMIGVVYGLEWKGAAALASLLFVIHGFGALMTEFGCYFVRGKIPVRQERLLFWWSCRVTWVWLCALVGPAVLFSVIRTIELRWAALPAAAVAFGCVVGIKRLRTAERDSIFQAEQTEASSSRITAETEKEAG